MSEETKPAGETPAPKREPLSLEQWEEIKRLIAFGEARVSECARRFGITASAVSQVISKAGITFGSAKKEAEEKVAKEMAAREESFAAKRVARIEQTKEQSYLMASGIQAETYRLVVEARKAGRPVANLGADFKALKNAMAIIQAGTEVRYLVLDAAREIDVNELPEIHIRDLTEEEISEIQSADDGAIEGAEAIDETVVKEGEDVV